MTKREFDAQTKRNYGQRMPSDTREDYRDLRERPAEPWRPWDKLELRAGVKRSRILMGHGQFALTRGSILRKATRCPQRSFSKRPNKRQRSGPVIALGRFKRLGSKSPKSLVWFFRHTVNKTCV